MTTVKDRLADLRKAVPGAHVDRLTGDYRVFTPGDRDASWTCNLSPDPARPERVFVERRPTTWSEEAYTTKRSVTWDNAVRMVRAAVLLEISMRHQRALGITKKLARQMTVLAAAASRIKQQAKP